MKIFGVHPVSNYEKFQNLLYLMPANVKQRGAASNNQVLLREANCQKSPIDNRFIIGVKNFLRKCSKGGQKC